LVYFMAIWYILWPFGNLFLYLVYVFYDRLKISVFIWYILWPFGNFSVQSVYLFLLRYVAPKNLASLILVCTTIYRISRADKPNINPRDLKDNLNVMFVCK
jgi:hypothetical protein